MTDGARRLSSNPLPGAAAHPLRDAPQRLTLAFDFPACPLFVYNPAFRTIGRPRLAIYSLPSIGPTCGGSRSR